MTAGTFNGPFLCMHLLLLVVYHEIERADVKVWSDNLEIARSGNPFVAPHKSRHDKLA